MTTWKDLKKELKSISPAEANAIDSLAYLHAQRVKMGISQQKLGKRIGMKQSQLAKIENLISIPSFETLERYANGLGLHAVVNFKPAINVNNNY